MSPGDFVRDGAQLRGIVLDLDWVRPEKRNLNASNSVPVARVAWANGSTTWIETKHLTRAEVKDV